MPIFKAYDIRGIYPQQLNEDIAYKIGKSIAAFLKTKEVIVGRDMRLTSNTLFDSLSEGITDLGVNIIDIGIVSSPMASFASGFFNKPCIMITASHNPKEYNGFKIMRANAIPVSADSGMKDIENLFNKNKFRVSKKKGIVFIKNIEQNYTEHVLKFVKNRDIKLKIVVDAGNGMGGKTIPLIFKHLKNVKIIPLYFKLDGNFPNHEANPLKVENVMDLQKRVLKEKAELGIALDGDADRVFFISDKAEIIPADFITCLIGKKFLEDAPGSTILYDLRSSWIVKEVIEANKGKTEMCKVGHSFIKENLRKARGIFAGELSGHFYFRDNYYADSGVIAILKLIELIDSENKKISELIKPLKKYYATGEINSEVKDKQKKIKELAEKYKHGKVSFLDGVRVDFDDWWFNVRPSNTEPLLRLNLEAKTKALMEKKKKEILKIIRS